MSENQTNLLTRRSTLARGAMTTGCVIGGALASVGAAAAQGIPPGGPAPARFDGDVRRDWQEFKRRYMPGDGRVVDTGNNGTTHTEGQGLGLLFSVAFDDPQTFDSVLSWTAKHLRRSNDTLHAWRYQPNLPFPVADWNNATDGDLFIATALLRASKRWGRPDLAYAAGGIARDVLKLLVREAGPWTVLMPGVEGFDFADNVTVNPSYYVFPALTELAEVAPSPVWAKLQEDGLKLLEAGRFGQWRLPPDWLRVGKKDGSLMPHPRWPARFSYDAIRVPLWLAWSKLPGSGVREAYTAWTEAHPVTPAWVDLTTDATANYPAPPGMLAVAKIATAAQQSSGKPSAPTGFPSLRASPDYYSAALVLLSRMAWQESRSVA
jgi:endoglucanase